MAIAAPFVIPAAEALWSAIVFVGSAITTGLGIAVAKHEIDKNFSETAPSAIQTCPMATQSAHARPWVDNAEAKNEHYAYKKIAGQPPPPGLDPCAELKWKLIREETVVTAMEQWDAKWWPANLPPRHAEAIRQRREGIRKLKEDIQRVCGE